MTRWIIVVDDDTANLQMAGHILSKNNMRVTALRSGALLLDYIKDKENGLLFKEQTVDSLTSAINKFESLKFDRNKISRSADGFAMERFNKEAADFIKHAGKALK